MFFLQRNKNISLNCYDFANFSALCFYRSSNTMIDFMSNTAVEVVNSRYRCLNMPSGSPGTSQNDQNTGRLSRRLPSGHHVDYHILMLLVDF